VIYDAHGYLGHNDQFATYGVPQFLGPDEWLRIMDDCGMQGALVAPPGVGARDDFKPDLEIIAQTVKLHPGRFFGYARVKPRRGEVALDELRYWIEDRGLHAVKMNTLDDDYRLDDRALVDPVMEVVSELGIPVLFHTGDSRGETCTPEMVADIALDFPDTTFIIGHMGYPEQDHLLVSAMKRAPNTVAESASVFRRVVIQETVDAIGAERILMGTNGPYSPIEMGPMMFRDYMDSLDEKQTSAILGGNLARILGVNS
jgi:predicted TIM-barrel fold metal-dependent hydrolase